MGNQLPNAENSSLPILTSEPKNFDRIYRTDYQNTMETGSFCDLIIFLVHTTRD